MSSRLRRDRPVMLPPEMQVKEIMSQIKKIHPDGIKQPPMPELEPPPAPNDSPPSPAAGNFARQPVAPPPAPAQPSVVPFNGVVEIHDVVQVTSRESRYYGVLFQVGDMTSEEVHGFYISPGGTKTWVTESVDSVTRIGTSVTRAHKSVSPEWEERRR